MCKSKLNPPKNSKPCSGRLYRYATLFETHHRGQGFLFGLLYTIYNPRADLVCLIFCHKEYKKKNKNDSKKLTKKQIFFLLLFTATVWSQKPGPTLVPGVFPIVPFPTIHCPLFTCLLLQLILNWKLFCP